MSSTTYLHEMSETDRQSIPEEIRDEDWVAAMWYAPFDIIDVDEVIYSSDGCNDGDNWVGVFRLKNGKFGYVSAGCDYTGWDCQAGGDGDIADTLEITIRDLCTDDDRRRFGIKLTEKV